MTRSTMILAAAALAAFSMAPVSAQQKRDNSAADDQAALDSCLAAVDLLAERGNLTAEPPQARPLSRDGVAPETLGQSGGVIEPPPTSDRSVIEPPETANPRMQTTPPLPGKTVPEDPDTPGLSPQERAVLKSMLQSARREAERGDEPGCRARLEAAERYLAERGG